MKCSILGGAGFLGSHLCDALLVEGHEVVVLDRGGHPCQKNCSATGTLEWMQGDFLDSGDVGRAIRGCEVVYHLVSTTLPKNSNDDPVHDIETNVVGTVRMLQLACDHNVRKVIFVSSGGTVYGVPRNIPITESHSNNPLCSYGVGKLAIEKYLDLFHRLHGLDYCVLRLSNPYGERQRTTGMQGAIAVFLHKALRNQSVEIWGDGSVVRDYLYVGDATRALLKAPACEAEWPVFNIGSGEGRSLNQVLAAIETLIGRPLKRSYLLGRPCDVPSNVLGVSRAEELLGWRPMVAFEEGLQRTWDWMKSAGLREAPAETLGARP